MKNTMNTLQTELAAARKPGMAKRSVIYLLLLAGAAAALVSTSSCTKDTETVTGRKKHMAEANDITVLMEMQRPVIVVAEDSNSIIFRSADNKCWYGNVRANGSRAMMHTYSIGDTLR